jgi:hypothetical protein
MGSIFLAGAAGVCAQTKGRAAKKAIAKLRIEFSVRTTRQ